MITISQPISVEGTILPPGQYLLRLQDSRSRQDVVNIETRLITTVVAIHASWLQRIGKSEFSFYDSPAGQPAVLQT